MVHYPAVQAAAQAEIDRIIGTDRLPVYKDRDLLPYLEALYKEVLRWHPVTPLGFPHALNTKEDDNYRGKWYSMTHIRRHRRPMLAEPCQVCAFLEVVW